MTIHGEKRYPDKTGQAPTLIVIVSYKCPVMIEIGPNLVHLLSGILAGLGVLVFFWMLGYGFLKIGGFTRKW